MSLVAISALSLLVGSAVEGEPALRISDVDGIAADLARLRCDDDTRYDAVSRLFETSGAPAAEIHDRSHRQIRNLVVRKAGSSAETIVVGAHYDKTPRGCGAVDNWTGVVAMAHLYSSVRDAPVQKTFLFVAFDDEEKGLLGSKAMVRAIPKAERRQYCSMINLDSLGLAMPQVLDNASHPRLRTLARDLAASMQIPFAHAAVAIADSDSTPFLRRGIPALTLHGLSDAGLTMLHSDEDQPSLVNATGVYLGYRLALALLVHLDATPCDSFR